MKALVLRAIGDARYECIPVPQPKQGQVRIRVGFCGICNSDISRFFQKGPYSFPLVCGHELAGTVDQIGSGVRGFVPGDRVAVFPLLWCANCAPCERGLYEQCLNYDYLGSRSDGGFAEFVVAPARNLLRIPPVVSLEEAALIEPAAVALHALRRAGGCTVGETVVVFGAGPIGLMVSQWARTMGASPVVLIDLVPEKLELARQLGVDHVIDARKQEAGEVIEKLTGGLGAHVCIDAAGVPQATLQAIRAARRGGRVVLLGNPRGDVTLSGDVISRTMRREVQIVGTWNSEFGVLGEDDDWHQSLVAMTSKMIRVKPLITHRVRLEGAFEALQMMKQCTEFYCKVLVSPESGG